MALNPFFVQGTSNEQSLIQDLINEQLRMYGVEVYYLPRTYLTTNTVIEEVIQSSFEDAYPIEAYVQNYEGYDDNTTLLSKFGIQSTQEMTFIISKERFENYITPLTEGKANLKLTSRPKEGDIIYMPLGDRMFEIKFVEHEKPFYQLQKNYVYELRCELFRYEDEVIDTGVEEIDDTLVGSDTDGISETGSSTVLGGSLTMTLIGTASTATAITGVINGGIRSITVGNQGAFYPVAPTVAISSAPSSGLTGIATAIIDRDSISKVNIVNPGFGYTVTPEILFLSNTGIGATASATLGSGSIGIITVTSGGSGYTTTPTITFTGVSTVSAAATAVVSAAGTITAIHITDTGIGYTEAPTITIGDPGSSDTGTFIFNELVTGSTSGTKARVRTWNTNTNVLELGNVTGTFKVGETIVGSTSSATHTIFSIDNDPADDGFSQNAILESQADGFLDFTERNPFGIP
tara:strand:- start:1803 stop:3191 length:1389 start_codon:yes stop_codon:yes gene_type:complete